MRIHMQILSTYVGMHIYICMNVCMYVCMYVYAHTDTCMHACMHTYGGVSDSGFRVWRSRVLMDVLLSLHGFWSF